MTDEFNNKTVTNDGDEIGTLLGGLKRVEAPGDFDFRVRARIAQGQPAERSRSWMPVWVTAAAPLALVLAVGGYLVSGGLSSPVDVPAVASFQEPAAAVPVEVSPVVEAREIAQAQTSASVDSPKVSPLPQSTRVTPPANRKVEKPVERSYDIGQSNARVILPPVNKTGTAGTSLSSLGVQVSGGTVSGITPGSRAAASGVRVGDVIESSNGGNLRIRRDGKTILIVIK